MSEYRSEWRYLSEPLLAQILKEAGEFSLHLTPAESDDFVKEIIREAKKRGNLPPEPGFLSKSIDSVKEFVCKHGAFSLVSTILLSFWTGLLITFAFVAVLPWYITAGIWITLFIIAAPLSTYIVDH